MTDTPVYTVGYGNREIEEFITILKRYEIEILVDVRSSPYSRHHPQFTKSALEALLQQRMISYVFMGESLGGRPSDESCYVGGRVDYALLSEKAFYIQGITRLRQLWEKQLTIAIMCAETKPEECHRGKLIGNSLLELQIPVHHIDENGDCKLQQEVNMLLTGGQQPLFTDMPFVALNGKMGRARKKVRKERA